MSDRLNLFEIATRLKYRFETSKGSISVEELWDLSLTALDHLAKYYYKLSQESTEISFIKTPTQANSLITNKLEILKYIINVKIEEKEESKKRVEKENQINFLKELRVRKSQEELATKSLEELNTMIAQLQQSS